MSPDLELASPPASISMVVRDFVLERLTNTVDGFPAIYNPLAQSRAIPMVNLRTTGHPPTLFLGRYDLPTVQRIVGSGLGTYCILSVAKSLASGRNNMRITPSRFSGVIAITIDFYVTHQSSRPPDGEAIYFTIEEGLINTFNTQQAMPQGVLYNNEIDLEQGRMEWDGPVYNQLVAATLLFNRITNEF